MTKTWLAEIERLRAAGKAAEADAEMAEYKRQHRAFAGSPGPVSHAARRRSSC